MSVELQTQNTQMNLLARQNQEMAKVGGGAPAPTSAPAPTESVAPQVPADAAQVSREAQQGAPTDKPQNPYEGVSDNFSTVTVDPWKKGKNDTVEGALRNQGYSLKDIYTKDKSGKTLIDHVAKANNLKNPNLILDGAKLKVPSRANSESLSSMDLKNGEQQSSQVANTQAGVTTTSEMSKDEKGNTTLGVGVDNNENKDAGLSTQTQVGEGGRIDTNSTAVEGGVETNTVAMNKNGSAVTEERIEATSNGTSASIRDIDRTGDNLSGTATSESVSVTNPGTNGAGDVKSSVDYSERGTDGTLERAGGWVNGKVDQLLGRQQAAQAPVNFNGAGQIDVNRNTEGQATVSGTKNGNTNTLLQTAGDTDDSWIERAGEWGDERVSDAKEVADAAWNSASAKVNSAKKTVTQAFGSAASLVSGLFGG